MVLAFSESGGGWEGTQSLLAGLSMTQYSEPGCCQQCVLVAFGEVLEFLVGTSDLDSRYFEKLRLSSFAARVLRAYTVKSADIGRTLGKLQMWT